MNGDQLQIYELLPAVYRVRDAEVGYPLQGLLEVIAEQVDVVDQDIAQLYDNWFIETCDEWVVPYISDLIGYRRVEDAGLPGDVARARGCEWYLVPRREVAQDRAVPTAKGITGAVGRTGLGRCRLARAGRRIRAPREPNASHQSSSSGKRWHC